MSKIIKSHLSHGAGNNIKKGTKKTIVSSIVGTIGLRPAAQTRPQTCLRVLYSQHLEPHL